MKDAGRRYAQQQNEVARQAVGGGERSAAVEAWTAAIETTSNDPGLRQEHVAALLRLGTLKRELGRPADAERLFTQAVAIGEKHLGAGHPSLKLALNELSRLYVRQSNHVRAEPVLQRLLEITRANGDRDPDVATVLAGLAVAKRGLGDVAEAEQLYRQALRIREEVLPANHMAIVVTLEQLSETCEARGSHAEALVHLQRALIRRESALGAEHTTVLALRERIADLERRHAESSARAAVLTPALPSAVIDASPSRSTSPLSIEPAIPADVSTSAASEGRATPIRLRSVPSAPKPVRHGELAFLYKPQPATSTPALPTRGAAPMSPAVSTPVPADRPARDLSSSVSVTDAPTISGASLFDISTAVSSRIRNTRHASIGAAVVVLAISGFIVGERGTNEGEHASAPARTEAPSTPVLPASVTSSPAPTAAASVVNVVRSRTPLAPTAASGETHVNAPRAQPTIASDEPSASTASAVAVPNLRKLVIPKVATPNTDSMMQASTKLAHDADASVFRASGTLRPSSDYETATVTPPVLIGSAPTPRFPDELRARPIEGEVIVQFRVNEKGRVEPSSMQVLQSQHELFTAAVRNVLSQFRFQPARSGGPDSKPQAAWVQFRTRFDARR